MAAHVRSIDYAQRLGADPNLVLSTDVVAGDWVLVITRRLGSAAPLPLPSWLRSLGDASGHYAGWQVNTAIHAGFSPASFTSLPLTDAVAFQTDVMLVSVQGARADLIQASAFSTGSPRPMPGFATPGGCFLLQLSDESGAAFFAEPYPGEAIVTQSEGPFVVRARLVEMDSTGDLPVGPPISGGWRAGMAFAIADPTDNRIRSTMSEDAGSLFKATQAVAVELGLSEAFPYGEDVLPGQLRAFREALTPDEVAARYYPLPTRNQEMLTTVEGETNLGRMASSYPSRIMVSALDIPGQVNGMVTAQQAIQYVTNQWSSEFPWLVFEPIPDLRIVQPGAVGAPRQHYLDNPAAGVLTIGAITIPQEGNERRTMREILDEWLSVFTGTIPRQTSRGTIELVPRVGPDAPDGASVALGWVDLLGITESEPDPRGVTNRARVTSHGWEFRNNEPLVAPAFTVFITPGGLQRGVLDAEEVLPVDSRQEFQPWDALAFSVLSTPAPITIDTEIVAFGSHQPAFASNFSVEGTATDQITLSAGQSQNISITHTSRGQSVTARFRITRSVEGDSITVTAPNGIPARATNPFGSTYLAYEVDLDVAGTGWVRTNEAITGEFGLSSDTLPAPSGGDALVDSRALHGERLATINSNVFQLTPEQAGEVARAYVLWNINPRTTRDIQQSEWNKYPVKFDHIGRYVDLPTGERAVIENRNYTDAFAALHGTMTSQFTATVSEVVIDTSTDWLYLDSGDFFRLDDGTPVERS